MNNKFSISCYMLFSSMTGLSTNENLSKGYIVYFLFYATHDPLLLMFPWTPLELLIPAILLTSC